MADALESGLLPAQQDSRGVHHTVGFWGAAGTLCALGGAVVEPPDNARGKMGLYLVPAGFSRARGRHLGVECVPRSRARWV